MTDSEPTLFVVEDDPLARDSVSALAASMGIRSDAYVSAEEFMEHCDLCRPGCLLVDLRLPGMDGIELQERLGAMGSQLPVVFSSAYLDVPTVVRAMQNGAVTVLEKPHRDGKLADAIRRALDVNRQQREAGSRLANLRLRIDMLNPKERQVMDLILADKPNRAIARRLSLAQRTIDRIRAALFEKMGVHSAVELAHEIGAFRARQQTREPERLDGQ